jgi:hypothetical protein
MQPARSWKERRGRSSAAPWQTDFHGNRIGLRAAGFQMALSAKAKAILERMEPNRSYDAQTMRGFAPDLTLEQLREVMRELWVARQVERVGHGGWRRERSSSPAAAAVAPRESGRGGSGAAAAAKRVKPEDLFDHNAFEGLFK